MLSKLEMQKNTGRNVKSPLVYKQEIFTCHLQVKLHEKIRHPKEKKTSTPHFTHSGESK